MVCNGLQCNNSVATSSLASRTRLRLRVAAAAGSALMLCASAAESRTLGPTPDQCRPQSPVAFEQDGIQKFLDIIRYLMVFLGGSPDTFPADPNAAMQAVVAYYNQHGPPQGLNPVEELAGRILVLQVYVALQPVAPGLNQAVVAQFEAMLGDLYAELGGVPADLH